MVKFSKFQFKLKILIKNINTNLYLIFKYNKTKIN